MNEALFIILGATGDLTKRKLIPAIYKLIEDKKIKKFAIVGAAISKTDIKQVLEKSKKFIKTPKKTIWYKIKKASYYHQLDFYNPDGYDDLKKLIKSIEKKHKLKGNRLFYLATLPDHFATIAQNLSASKIIKKHTATDDCETCTHPWSRIVYEKPFGSDLKSAKEINKIIAKLFHEKQTYRIDHYLGKELVSNIALIRFTNRIFEPLWNNKHIESVQIIFNEKIGIEGRGAFYDRYGALKDVVQNHMLQMLSLTAMEPPKSLQAKDIRNVKYNVLKKTKITSLVLGQYQGYKKEKRVDPKSNTETFAALKLEINNKRWKGVPFYLKTGKYLDSTETSIHIKFKMVKCLLTQGCPTDSNYLTIKINPDDGFYLDINAKEPGTFNEIVPVEMNFCHSCIFGPNTPAAYENLLFDVIEGDQSAFVRADEIEQSWKIIEQIKKEWFTVHPYKKGSTGPKEIKSLDKKIVRWRA